MRACGKLQWTGFRDAVSYRRCRVIARVAKGGSRRGYSISGSSSKAVVVRG